MKQKIKYINALNTPYIRGKTSKKRQKPLNGMEMPANIIFYYA